MGLQWQYSFFYAWLCFVAVCVVRTRWPGCPEWGGSRVRIVCSFIHQYVPVGEKMSAMLPCFAVRDIAAFFLRRCRPPASTATASTLLRTTTAVLSHSLASFNYQAFVTDPLGWSAANRSKTAEVVENISCQRNLFPETHLCKLYMIPRSRVLLSA